MQDDSKKVTNFVIMFGLVFVQFLLWSLRLVKKILRMKTEKKLLENEKDLFSTAFKQEFEKQFDSFVRSEFGYVEAYSLLSRNENFLKLVLASHRKSKYQQQHAFHFESSANDEL